MPLREFLDADGELWSVWEVQPSLLDPRSDDAIILADGAPRWAAARRAPVAIELRFGWLVFQSKTAKRRLAPVPVGWDRADETVLLELLDRATARDGPRVAGMMSADSARQAESAR